MRADPVSILRRCGRELCERFGIRALTVFGSVARNEATAASDVDVVAEFDGATTFDRYFDLKEALEGLLDAPVDLATPEMLRGRVKAAVDREGIRVA